MRLIALALAVMRGFPMSRVSSRSLVNARSRSSSTDSAFFASNSLCRDSNARASVMSARETLVIPNGRDDSTPPMPPEKSREIATSPIASAAMRSSSRARSRSRFSRSKTPRRYRRSPALRANAPDEYAGEDDRSDAPPNASPRRDAGALDPNASAVCDVKRRADATPPGADCRDSRNSRAARRRSTVASSARARLAATRARSFPLSAVSADLEVASKPPG